MAIVRSAAASNEERIELHNRDIETVFQELNKGLDPSTIPQGRITSDKLAITISGTGSTGYLVNSTSIAAGAVGWLNFGVTTNNLGAGVGNGNYFPITPYYEIFVDPTGSGPLTIANIYSGNNPDPSGNIKFMGECRIRASASTIIPQMFQALIKVHNTDTVAHNYYVVVNFEIVNSQATASQ
jgi:hypothetical protein